MRAVYDLLTGIDLDRRLAGRCVIVPQPTLVSSGRQMLWRLQVVEGLPSKVNSVNKPEWTKIIPVTTELRPLVPLDGDSFAADLNDPLSSCYHS